MITNIYVIADDLTGANDTAVQFNNKGFPTTVMLGSQARIHAQEGTKVTVINTDTRALSKEEAYSEIRKISKKISNIEKYVIYKKIDSMMRGNIGIEIDALMDDGNFDICVVVPAYPRNNRITVGGYHLVKNNLLEDSEASKDSKLPVKESYLPDILKGQTDRKVGYINIKKVRSNKIICDIDRNLKDGKQIFIIDSVLDSDLKAVTSQLCTTKYNILWVGSAGLASALSEEIKLYNKIPTKPICSPGGFVKKKKGLAVLTVAGSLSEATREQKNYLIEQGVKLVSLNPIHLFNNFQITQLPEYKGVLELLSMGKDVCVTTQYSNEVKKKLNSFLKNNNIEAFQSGNIIANGLGQFAASLIKDANINCVILTGGDIACQTLKQLKIDELKIVSEIEEGIPLCKVVGGKYDSLLVITKAGSFGNKFSLYNAMKSLTK